MCNCLEFAEFGDESLGLRDSKEGPDTVYRFTFGEWEAFTLGVKEGEFDSHTFNGEPSSSSSVAPTAPAAPRARRSRQRPAEQV